MEQPHEHARLGRGLRAAGLLLLRLRLEVQLHLQLLEVGVDGKGAELIVPLQGCLDLARAGFVVAHVASPDRTSHPSTACHPT
ncbi:hypothetical protein D7X75_21960, partial [Corallococcus sp. CA031C]